MTAKEFPVDEWAAILGDRIRVRRRALGLTVVAAAEAAGMSRITWHRLERGYAGASIASYAAALRVLGLPLGDPTVDVAKAAPRSGWIPARIRAADYPQLQALAWHVAPNMLLTPREALDIYERNARHLDQTALSVAEQQLVSDLRAAFPPVNPVV